MNKISLLVFANIRKTKGHTVSLFIMFLIAALLLNAGLLVFLNFGNYFGEITKELNTSDIYYVMPSSYYNENIEEYLDNNENIIELEKEQSLWALAKMNYNNETRERVLLFNDADHPRNMSRWKFVGKHLPIEGMSIYLPYIFQLDGGYELNDIMNMEIKGKQISFTVKGFIEDAFFSSPETGPLGVYMPQATYRELKTVLDASSEATLIFANLREVNKDIESAISNRINKENIPLPTDITSTLFSWDLPLIKTARIMMAAMLSVMIVAFALIIVSICLIVVRFRIGNSIEDDMTKIGSLKAVGYTSGQIILSVVLQFTYIALAGSLVGIALSYLAIPVLSDVFAQQSGLMWEQGFDGGISAIALGIILSIVGIVALLSSRRISKLHPILALRGGITTHSFQKNHLPLSSSRGSLPFVLALKSILQNKKQSFMIILILSAVSFAQTFAFVMFYNTTVDTKTFMETPGIELSNAIAVLNPSYDKNRMLKDIGSMEEVRKLQFIDEVKININNNEVSVYVMEDYSQKETDSVYKGRYPIHNNEIVLAGHLADMIGKTVGDYVTLRTKESVEQFVVTGLSQGAYMGGMNSSITYDGMMKLDPEFKQQNLNIYLKKGVIAEEFLEKMEGLYGEYVIYTMDMDTNMQNGAGVYISIVSKVGISILYITIAVVILVLYFVINSLIVRKRRELGIQKAIGYTTIQLMNQLSISFLLPIIVGVIIGSLLGITQTNAIMSLVQRGMGIMKANFIVKPFSISLFSFGIIILSYSSSMLIASRIRKITAYGLVSE